IAEKEAVMIRVAGVGKQTDARLADREPLPVRCIVRLELAVRVRRTDAARKQRVVAAVTALHAQIVPAGQQEQVVEPNAPLAGLRAQRRFLLALAVVVSDLQDFVADHLKTPELRVAGGDERVEIRVVTRKASSGAEGRRQT